MSDFSEKLARTLADLTIKLTCAECGDVEARRENIWLTEIDVPGRSWFGFDCPRCDRRGTRNAGPELRRFLRRFVATEQVQVPAEALEHHPWPALTGDDVLDAILELRQIETLEDL